jgi:DNA modification methylase
MDTREINYDLVDVDTLIPYARNARTHSEQQISQIAASIKEFGFLSPIVISGDNTILCGHGRLYAAQKLGLKKIPCVKENYLTEAQKRAYILADNRLALNAGWDEEMLSIELSELEGADFDLDLLGFTDAELHKLLGEIETEEDDFDLTAALEEASFVKAGDVWTVGKHRLICGDATKREDVQKLMDGKKANLILTDPPYAVSYESASGLSIKNDNLKAEEFYDFLLSSFKNMIEVSEAGASAYVFHADTEGLTFRKAFEDAGFHLSGVCIWAKDSLVLGRSPYQWSHEPILFGWNKKGKHEWYAGRAEKTVWQFNKPKKNENHPTSKPIDLLSYPIQNSSRANGIVLDLFGGSGSTLIACEQTDRICYMAEVDDKYASVILRRYVEFKSGDSSDVFVERDGKKITYKKLVKTVG